MKTILVTGVTGYIGGSIAAKLIERNYKVSGLMRNQHQENQVKNLGITPVIASLNELRPIKEIVKQVDAVINAADADDPFFVATVLEELKGTQKTFIHTSGSSIVAHRDGGEYANKIYHEDMPIDAALEKLGRIAINKAVIEYSLQDIRTIVIVPTMVYGEGLGIKNDSIQLPKMIELAKIKGNAAHIGKGENIWSNVHIEDLAELYVLALENALPGSLFYAENGESSYKEIAITINQQLGFTTETLSIDIDEAIGYWGPEGAHFAFGSNSRVTSEKARSVLGWNPKQRSIINYINGI